jgi:NitT/TauT family transport system ATP-binding protein
MSARPGRIVASYEIPFSYPRHPDLRFEPTFAELCGEVSQSLRRGAHV